MNAKDERYSVDEVIETWVAGGPSCHTELDPRQDSIPAFRNERKARVCRLWHRDNVLAHRVKRVDGVDFWLYDGPNLMEPGTPRAMAKIIAAIVSRGYFRVNTARALFSVEGSGAPVHYVMYRKAGDTRQ